MECRVSSGSAPVHIFNIYSCSLCYNFIVKDQGSFTMNGIGLTKTNGSGFPMGNMAFPNVRNISSLAEVCDTMESTICDQWKDCCMNAVKCCERQLSKNLTSTTPGYCPQTWDGFSCFDEAKAGDRVYTQCPSYLAHSLPDATAYKDCTENATWFVNIQGREWTNYSTCVEIKDQHVLIYLGLACSLASILLLVVSCFIFIYFRQLRLQQRIRLHVSLFLSFIVTAVVAILWDFLVYYDRLEKSNPEESRMFQNSGGCKFLYALVRYTETSNYFWMFCEGFYLHRLIVHAFEVPKTLIGYYIYGWGVAWLPVVIYCIIRATTPELDQKCWVDHAGNFEFLIYVPNLLSVLANIFFFVNILRILLTQLQSHPNEPSNYRRAFRATFVLVPLFGIQWALLVYRPTPDSPLKFTYEVASKIIKNSQGGIVALIFCIFNGEVHTLIKNYIHKRWPDMFDVDNRYTSAASTTQYTHVPTGSVRRSPRLQESEAHESYIPLNTVPDDKVKNNGHVTFDDQSPT